jgi:hypothetical protein
MYEQSMKLVYTDSDVRIVILFTPDKQEDISEYGIQSTY